MNWSDYGSKELRTEGTFKVVQVAINGDSLLYFGALDESTHGIILKKALEENLGRQTEHPSREGIDYRVIGMGKVDLYPALKKMVFSDKSLGYGMNMQSADIAAIQAAYPDWEIVLSY